MLLQFRVPDDLYAHYAERNPKAPNSELERSLEKWKNLDPREQYLILGGKQLRELKDLLGWPVSTPEDLLAHLRKWSQVEFPEEGLKVQLTPEQRQKLKAQSAFWDQGFQDFLQHQFQAALTRVIG